MIGTVGEYRRVGKLVAHEVRAAIRGCVVDHDQLGRPLGAHRAQERREQLARVVAHDRDRDVLDPVRAHGGLQSGGGGESDPASPMSPRPSVRLRISRATRASETVRTRAVRAA